MKFYSIFILILIIISVVIIFGVWSNVLKIKKLSQTIFEQRVRLEKLYNQGQLLKKAREDLKQVSSKIEILDKSFVIKNEELKFITTLEELAAKNKLEQNIALNFSQQRNLKPGFNAVPFQLTLRGNFLNILKYLAETEKMDYYFNIESLSLENLVSQKNRTPSENFSLSTNEKTSVQALISAESYWKE